MKQIIPAEQNISVEHLIPLFFIPQLIYSI